MALRCTWHHICLHISCLVHGLHGVWCGTLAHWVTQSVDAPLRTSEANSPIFTWRRYKPVRTSLQLMPMYVFQKTAGRGWNVTLSCLWLLLAVYQAAYVSCDEYDNQILPGQLLFAPKQLLSSGSCLTTTAATCMERMFTPPTTRLPVPSSIVSSLADTALWRCRKESRTCEVSMHMVL